ncbi:SpoIIE family protein phosphatase [Rubripirellula tenax]|uniref:SpoIIE family protein phosphatase n=1 Tax=Rubripirellula tenax TaxID=2528015 RepID=UPI00164854CF|nr:SpoIIE family protein phosphatase [Rubripirellula tenax]
MTKTLPNYLKVHRGPDHQNADAPRAGLPTCPPLDAVEQFWNDFSCATGWRLDRRAQRRDEPVQVLPAVSDVDLGSVFDQVTDLDALNGNAPEHRVDPTTGVEAFIDPASPSLGRPHYAGPEITIGLGKADATQLAESAARITAELEQTREALRAQSVELAARAALITGEGEATRLADRIQTLMSDACQATDCDAAILYLLDDNTEYLQARAAFGISPQTLSKAPRPLRGSRGDLEAMVRDVVTIDDFAAGSIDTWNAPESFAAGVCVVIKSADVPIGTLWLFANDTAEFGERDSSAARLVAAAISLELNSASHRRDETVTKKQNVAVRDLATWQQESMPVGAVLADHWRVDGMIESPADWATGWHTWDVLPDGSMMLAIAEAVDCSVTGVMHATIARAALAAHTGYRHTPAQMLGRISDTLWQTSTGEQLVSLLYARIDSETGEGEVASAGSITAMIGNRYGYRPLVDGCGEPLNSHIDARPVMKTFRLLEGETLLAYTRGMASKEADQRLLGNYIRTSMTNKDRNPLATIRRQLADQPLMSERGAVSLLRH